MFSEKIIKNKKRLLAALLTVSLLFGNISSVLALTPPPAATPPPALTPPPASTPPPAGTPPPALTPPPVVTPTPTPTPTPAPSVLGSSETPLPTPTAESQTSDSNTTSNLLSDESQNTGETNLSSNEESTGQQDLNGAMGGVDLSTGDATSTGGINTSINSNLATVPSGSGGGSATIANTDNGADSTNTGSATVNTDNTTNQDNSATVINNLDQSAVTGDNSASGNTGGDVNMTTGDANVSGTIINSVNTNVAGISVAEFNVLDDHTGDIILDFSSACPTSGCLGGDNTIINSDNGAGSTNTGELNLNTNNTTDQTNTAYLENNMDLLALSGSNEASKNTNGDSSITTGDANVAANILNFVNNNIAGNVVYGVVNIFGDLIGDILFPEEAYYLCCDSGDLSLLNSGNGANSTNTTEYNANTVDTLNQFNIADIDNNLFIDANTGGNDTSKNTNGNSSITTGDVNVDASILNIANNNLIGGNWWLVIVNEAGKWVGKIVGSDGGYLGGSSEFEFLVGENGEITVANTGNGADTTNSAVVNQNTTNTINQTNDAVIVNNLNLEANTGDNSASKNTGGNSKIVTGDANVVANIVNFVNNNIVGSGKLFITVVNVFGSWLGDFYGPGQSKAKNVQENAPAVGGAEVYSENSNTSSSDSGGGENNNQESNNTTTISGNLPTSGKVLAAVVQVAGSKLKVDDPITQVFSSPKEAGKKLVRINLAWFLFALVPVGIVTMILRRKKYIEAILTHKKNV